MKKTLKVRNNKIEIKKLVEKCIKEIKHHNKLINENKKKFDRIIMEAQKNRAKFEKQLKLFKR